MADKIYEGCDMNCGSCAAVCDDAASERPRSFFDKLEAVSEYFDKIGEENFINMLSEAVAELEAEDEA